MPTLCGIADASWASWFDRASVNSLAYAIREHVCHPREGVGHIEVGPGVRGAMPLLQNTLMRYFASKATTKGAWAVFVHEAY